MTFKIFGYSVDYFSENKYKGSISGDLSMKGERELGYGGRERFTLSENIKLDNNRVLKKGTSVTTEMISLQGKWEK